MPKGRRKKNKTQLYAGMTAKDCIKKLLKTYDRNCVQGELAVIPSVKSALRECLQEDMIMAKFIIQPPTVDENGDPIIDGPKFSISPLLDALRQERYVYIRLLFVWSILVSFDDIVTLASVVDKGIFPLKHLELFDCAIDVRSLRRLTEGMPYCPSLINIVLDYNEFGDEGCLVFCKGMRGNRTLLSLSMNYCNLTVASGTVLGAFVSSTAVRELYLNGNMMTAEGALHIVLPSTKQANIEEEERQMEEQRKLEAEALAEELAKHDRRNYGIIGSMTSSADRISTTDNDGKGTKKKRRKGKNKKKEKPLPPPPPVGPWIYKLHLAENGIDDLGTNGRPTLLTFIQTLAQLIVHSKCLQEVDLLDNQIGEISGIVIAEALDVRRQADLPPIKLRTTHRISIEALMTIQKLGAGAISSKRKKPKKKK